MKEQGVKIAIRFTQPIIGDYSGLENENVSEEYYKVQYFTVSAENQKSGYPAQNVCDGSTETFWYSSTQYAWLKTKLYKPLKITKFRMYLSSYYIKTFSISASNDDSTWIDISGTLTAATSNSGKWYEFLLNVDKEYQYYKIIPVTTYSSYIWIYEIEWYITRKIGNEVHFQVTFPEPDMEPSGTIKTVTRSVDKITQDYYSIDNDLDLNDGDLTGTQYLNGMLILGVVTDGD